MAKISYPLLYCGENILKSCDSTKEVNRKFSNVLFRLSIRNIVSRYKAAICTLYSVQYQICTHNIPLANSLTAELILLFSKYVTQVWLAWRQAEPFWLIAELAQTSTKFGSLTLSAFSWANSSLRRCLIARPRCFLLGQLQLEFSVSAVWPAWWGWTCLTKSNSLYGETL